MAGERGNSKPRRLTETHVYMCTHMHRDAQTCARHTAILLSWYFMPEPRSTGDVLLQPSDPDLASRAGNELSSGATSVASVVGGHAFPPTLCSPKGWPYL